MNTSSISIAVIGIGGFGAYHLSIIRALHHERGIRLIAVADPKIDQLEQERKELGEAGVRVYADYQKLLDDEPSLNAVTICAPIPYHGEIVKACLKRGLYIYLEKPPVPLIQQLDELIEADSSERVSVGFQQIASPVIQQIKQWISRGKLGEIEHIRVGASWPRRDGYYGRAAWVGKMTLHDEPVFDGPATNALAHLIHNIMYLAGDGPEHFAVPVEVQGELYRARPIESYDVASLRGTFASGTQFSAALTHASETELPFRIEVTGGRGWARISRNGQRLESSLGNRDYPHEGIGDHRLRESYLWFIDWVEGKRERPITRLRDARGYVLTTNAMLQSSGDIHHIGPQWVRRYILDRDSGCDVEGLLQAIETSFQTGETFSEMKVPWAVESTAVSLAELTHLNFAASLVAIS